MAIPDPHEASAESQLLATMLEYLTAGGATNVLREVHLGNGRRADLVITGDPDQIVEVRNITPQTSTRLEDVVAQMRVYRDALADMSGRPAADMVIVTPGVLGPGQTQYLAANGITAIDGNWLWRQTDAIRGTVGAANFGLELFKRLAEGAYQHSREDELIDRLKVVKPGKENWLSYQRLCLDILNHLFNPPLNRGLWENRDAFGVNRRDIILPNYATEGFWRFLRQDYRADHIVVDAKNYTSDISKSQVIAVANYLARHGLVRTDHDTKRR